MESPYHLIKVNKLNRTEKNDGSTHIESGSNTNFSNSNVDLYLFRIKLGYEPCRDKNCRDKAPEV